MDGSVTKTYYTIVKISATKSIVREKQVDVINDDIPELDSFFEHLGSTLMKRQEIRSQNDCRMMLVHFMSQMSFGANQQIKNKN